MDKLFGILHALGSGITIEAKVGGKIERIAVFAAPGKGLDERRPLKQGRSNSCYPPVEEP
jgi:hypothetical protein